MLPAISALTLCRRALSSSLESQGPRALHHSQSSMTRFCGGQTGEPSGFFPSSRLHSSFKRSSAPHKAPLMV